MLFRSAKQQDREALGAASVGRQGADLYLSGDLLQAAATVAGVVR